MITEATLAKVKYPPEQLPDSAVTTIAITSESSPTLLDLRQLPPWVIRLSEIAADQDDDVLLRFRVDTMVWDSLAGSMFNLLANNFSLFAKNRIYYNLYNSSGVTVKTDYKTFQSLCVIKPTVAYKLRYGIPLTGDDVRLNRELGISDSVDKGVLPLPLKHQIEREYQVIQEETHGFQVTVPTAGVDVETLHPLNGQFLVLTKLTADPGVAAADNIRIAIDRDYEVDFLDFPTWGLGATAAVTLGKEISAFIPAVHELRIKLKATVSRTINIRYTILKCAMTNLFRARWGLATKEELPGDVYDKVMAGVL